MDQPAVPNRPGSHPSNRCSERDDHVELIARGLWIHADQVLLCKNLESGYFYFPGGHVEFGESGAAALEREMMEEAGVSVRAGGCVLVGECSFEQKGRRRHEINLVFHVEHPEVATKSHPSGECPPPVASLEPHIAFQWVRLDALRSADVRPRWLAHWVLGQSACLGPASTPQGPAWVSCMTDPSR